MNTIIFIKNDDKILIPYMLYCNDDYYNYYINLYDGNKIKIKLETVTNRRIFN